MTVNVLIGMAVLFVLIPHKLSSCKFIFFPQGSESTSLTELLLSNLAQTYHISNSFFKPFALPT